MSNKLVYIDDILAKAKDVTLEGGAKHKCFDVALLSELDTVALQQSGCFNCERAVVTEIYCPILMCKTTEFEPCMSWRKRKENENEQK